MKKFFAFIIVICIVIFAIPLTASAEAQYVSVTEAADNLREGMVNRQAAILLKYKTKDVPTEESIDEMFAQAVAENGRSTSGDYLYSHINSYGAGGEYRFEDGYYYCDITFEVEYYTTKKQEDELTTAINKLIPSFGFTQSTEDYTKIKTVYEYICNNVDYDYDNLNDDDYKLKYSAYAALINKTAICQGYANLFYRLLRELGINNRIVYGTSSNQSHSWNIVELDGVYYNADSTWDAPTDSFLYFLKCGDHFDDHLRNGAYTDSAFLEAYPTAEKCYTPAPTLSECEKSGHDFGNWYVTKAATETETGEERRDCSRCDRYETRTVPVIEALENRLGDINGNGEIEKYDYITVKRACMSTLTLSVAQQKIADVNESGSVEKYDYILIKRHCMGTYVIEDPS